MDWDYIKRLHFNKPNKLETWDDVIELMLYEMTTESLIEVAKFLERNSDDSDGFTEIRISKFIISELKKRKVPMELLKAKKKNQSQKWPH